MFFGPQEYDSVAPRAARTRVVNVWWRVSVEDRRLGLPRIDELRAAPARTRSLAVEPLLEDLGQLDLDGGHECRRGLLAFSDPGSRIDARRSRRRDREGGGHGQLA